MNPLYIDDRAGSIELVQHEPLTSTAELCRLDSGDVMFCGEGPSGPVLVGIEVKSIYDLVSSITTGRLQGTQLPALCAAYDERRLLIYGSYGPGPGGVLSVYGRERTRGLSLGRGRPIPYSYIEAFLCDVAALGIGVKNVGNAYAAAQWIGVLHKWWSKPWDKHKGLRAFDKSREVALLPGMDEGTLFRAGVASKLPGLGFERAVSAALHFPTVAAMVEAGVASWEQVPGVGRVLAKAIVESIRRT